MILAWQYKLFPESLGEFSPNKFNGIVNEGVDSRITYAFQNANEIISYTDFELFDKSTRASMINNIVTKCAFDKFGEEEESRTLKIDRRRVILINNEYLLLFKKTPISYNHSEFSKEVENQLLPNHVLTVSYTVDDFYSSITSATIEYRMGGNTMYSWGINIDTTIKSNVLEELNEIVVEPKVALKQNKKVAL